MIKKYKQYIKESLLDKISGPNEDEILNNLLDEYSNDLSKIYWISMKSGLLKGIQYVINDGLKLSKSQIMEAYIRCNYLDGVKQLIEDGFPIDGEKYNFRPIDIALEYNQYEIVKYLISKGAIIDYNDIVYLSSAIKFGHFDIVKFLIKKGADVNKIELEDLGEALDNEYYDIILYLINNGLYHESHLILIVKYMLQSINDEKVLHKTVRPILRTILKAILKYNLDVDEIFGDRYWRNLIPEDFYEIFKKKSSYNYD